jgi:putative ABC transport system substrate-binding protein
MRLVTLLPAMPYSGNKGQEKRVWTTGNERSKQGGMGKKATVVLLIGLALTSAHLADAQQRVYRVGVLLAGSPDVPEMKGLRDGVKEAGYIEGKNLILDIPATEKSIDQLRPQAKEYIEKKVDVIVGIGATPVLITKELTQEVPLVFVGASDPVLSGLVKSVARPEANVTGVARATDVEMQGKRLEVFKEAVPTLRRVTVLYNARGENPAHDKNLALLQKVAPNLGLKLTEKPVKSTADIDRVLFSVSKDSTDGLFVICSGIFRDAFKKIAAMAIQKKLASTGCSPQHVTELDILLAYSADAYRIGHRGAWYVDRILKGSKPKDLPVEAPTYFEFVINLKTAKQIGLTIPPNVLARADKVIK